MVREHLFLGMFGLLLLDTYLDRCTILRYHQTGTLLSEQQHYSHKQMMMLEWLLLLLSIRFTLIFRLSFRLDFVLGEGSTIDNGKV